MDPFSVAASVVGILAATDQAQKCIRRLRALRNAHSEIVAVVEEVSDISRLLSEVFQIVADGCGNHSSIQSSDDARQTRTQRSTKPNCFWQPGAVETLDILGHRAATKLEELTSLVPNIAKASSTDEAQRNNHGRDLSLRLRIKEEHWRWFRCRSQVRKLLAELRSLQTNILANLSVIASSAGLQLISTSATIAISPYEERTSAENSRLLEQDIANASVICEIEEIIDEKPKMTRRLPIAPDGTLAASPQQARSNTIRASSLSRPRRSACEPFCSCPCHRKSFRPFRGPASKVYGAIFVSSNGTFLGFNKCIEKKCRGNAGKTLKLIFKPPRWLSAYNIQLLFFSDPTYGPEINIRLPRCIDWDAPVWKLAVLGDTQGIIEMFDKGEASPFDVNPLGGSLLHYAIDRCYFDLCRLLLQRGATPSIYDDNGGDPTKTAWDLFLTGKLTQDQEIFVRDSFDDDYLQARQFTILHKIVLGLTKLDLTSMLEVSTADIDTCDAEGRTCLSWASSKCDAGCVETLLSFGADPNLADLYTRTPLHYVQSSLCCELLIKGGAVMASTVLHLAASPSGNAAVLRTLVAHGADLHARDSYGDTPLVVATYNGYIDCVLALLEGLQDHKNGDGSEIIKVFGVAILFGRVEIIEHMQDYSEIGHTFSRQFLDTVPGSETEATLLKWFQETRADTRDFQSEHEAMMQFLIGKQNDLDYCHEQTELLESRIVEIDLNAFDDGEEDFVDAVEHHPYSYP